MAQPSSGTRRSPRIFISSTWVAAGHTPNQHYPGASHVSRADKFELAAGKAVVRSSCRFIGKTCMCLFHRVMG